MAFPKTQSGSDPMLEAPSAPEPKQFEELGLRFVGLPPKRTEGEADRRTGGRRSGIPGARLRSPAGRAWPP